MTRKRLLVAALSAAAAIALYALLGFFVLPRLAQHHLVAYVEERLDHRLALDAMRFNPFTGVVALDGVDLRDADGTRLVAWRHLMLDLSLRGLWDRVWSVDHVRLENPQLVAEMRPDGRHNFSRLLQAMRDPTPDRERPLPRLAIRRIEVVQGRVELADLAAGPDARLTLAPVDFELVEFSTAPSASARYTLSARSADGERIAWHGELSAEPVASHGRIALHGWNTATLARWLGRRVALEGAEGTLDLTAEYRAQYANGDVALTVTDGALTASGVALRTAAGGDAFASVQNLQVHGVTFDLAARTVAVERLELAGPQVKLTRGADGTGNWPGAAEDHTAPAPRATSTAETAGAARQGNDTRTAGTNAWSIELRHVSLSDAGFSFADALAPGQPQLLATGVGLELAAEASVGADAITAALSQAKLAAGKVSATLDAQPLEAAESHLSVDAADLSVRGSAIEAAIRGATAATASLTAKRGEQDWRVQKLTAQAESVRVDAGQGSDVMIEAQGLAGELAGLSAHLLASAKPAVAADAVSAQAKTLLLQAGQAATQITAADIGGSVRALFLRDPATGSDLARLGLAEIGGVSLTASERRVAVERLAATDAHATTRIAADGTSNWDRFLTGLLGSSRTGRASPAPAKETGAWHVQARSVELNNFAGAFSDIRHDPPLAVELVDVHARAQDVRSDRDSPLRLDLRGRLAHGGSFRAGGQVRLQPLASDLQVQLADLPLTMAQPYIAPHLRLQLVSGLASAQGRLRYGGANKAGAALLFQGSFGLSKVVMEETQPQQPLLALETLTADQVTLALEPNRLEIADVRVEKLASRLIIGEDQRVNIAKLQRKPQAPAAGDASVEKTAPVAQDAPAPESEAFPITISRIRLRDSVLEFADLSLRPQFQTRMHELHGVVTGLSSSGGTRARMELEARVDEFGSAQIEGTLNPFQPERFTDVTLLFRNLEMTALTPYAAKFAGYRIASGKLSLDLRYRVKNSALVGENKIVIDKLELGERVESPSALDLPLELAVAILKDENGRIDIGLPVSGNLADPQFDIGAIVWKALGSLLGRVVTAPFRALAALFGGGQSDELDAIAFAPGAARLAPPERQKLQTVGAALGKRPELKLTVDPVYAPQADRAALQSLAVRRAVLTRAGVRLDPDEAPGPLDYGNTRIQRAIEALFAEAFGEPAVRDLRAELGKPRDKVPPQAPAPADAPSNAPAAIGAQPAAAAKRASIGAIRAARAMVQRLTDAQAVGAAELDALAVARADGIAAELVRAGKLDPARITRGAPRASRDETGQSVSLELKLGVAR